MGGGGEVGGERGVGGLDFNDITLPLASLSVLLLRGDALGASRLTKLGTEVPTEAGRGLRGVRFSRSFTPAVEEDAEPADEALRVMTLLGREGGGAEGARKDLGPSGMVLRAESASHAGASNRTQPKGKGEKCRRKSAQRSANMGGTVIILKTRF